VRRGFDQDEVRSYLETVGAELARLQHLVDDLDQQLKAARAPAEPEPIDIATLTSRLGEETARVLMTAQEAAADLRARAEEGAARTLKEAHEEAARLRAAAETVLAERTTEAEEAAETIRGGAAEEASRLRREARAEADATVAAAVTQGKDMLAQAQGARDRVLGDLTRRRKAGLSHIEQLRAARERLLDSFASARAELDRLAEEFDAADGEAADAWDAVTRAMTKGHTGGSAAPADGPAPASEPIERADEVLAGSGTGAVVPEPVVGSVTVVRPGLPADRAEGADDPVVPSADSPASGPAVPSAAGDGPNGAGSDPPVDSPVAEMVTGPPVGSEGDEAPGPDAGLAAPGDPISAAVGDHDPADDDPAGPEATGPDDASLGGPGPADRAPEPTAADGPLPDGGTPPSSTAESTAPAPGQPGPGHAAAPAGSEQIIDLDADLVVLPDTDQAAAPYPHDPVPAALLPEAAVGEQRPGEGVDQLFARIRADRAHAVEEARAVLAPERPEPAHGPVRKRRGARRPTSEPVPASPGSASPGPAVAEPTPTAGPVGADAPAGDGFETPRRDSDEAYLERRDTLLEGVLSGLVRTLKLALADDQNAALDRARTLRGPLSLESLVGPADEQLSAWAVRAAAPLGAAAAAGARLAGKDSAGPVAAKDVAALASSLAGELLNPLRARLGEVLDGGSDQSQELADRVGAAYRECRARVDGAAGDALTAAVSAGFAAGAKAGTAVVWVVDDVGGPCPDCDDNALAGATPLGEAFPTGQLAPPAHPGCRCVLSRTTT